MTKNTIAIAFFLLSFPCAAQTHFETGYFIDLNGMRTVCLIKNQDWLRSPTSIKYKLADAGAIQDIEVTSLKEFSVSDIKYICTTVKLDTSSQELKSLTTYRSPSWDTRYVALRQLVDGKGKLYLFDNRKLMLFFYSVDGLPVEQLEYKTYNLYEERTGVMRVGENINYLNQLQTRVNCGNEYSRLAQHKMKYKNDFLVDYFRRFNKCSGDDGSATQASQTKRKQVFHLKLAPGIDFSTADVFRWSYSDSDFPGRKVCFRIGVEAEYILPFKNNTWGMFVEPTYQSYSNDSRRPIEYSSIEMPLGLRRYFFLNDKTTIFLNAALVFDYVLECSTRLGQYTFTSETFKVNYALGMGMGHGRFGIEGRFYSIRSRLDKESMNYQFDFSKFSVILGYRLF